MIEEERALCLSFPAYLVSYTPWQILGEIVGASDGEDDGGVGDIAS